LRAIVVPSVARLLGREWRADGRLLVLLPASAGVLQAFDREAFRGLRLARVRLARAAPPAVGAVARARPSPRPTRWAR